VGVVWERSGHFRNKKKRKYGNAGMGKERKEKKKRNQFIWREEGKLIPKNGREAEVPRKKMYGRSVNS